MRVLNVQMSLPLAVALAAIVSPAFAGGFARGYGKTPEAAQKAALEAAESAVRTRGTGCVGHRDPGRAMRLVGEQNGLWIFEAHYNHHNGSCHRQSRDQEYLKQLGVELVRGFASKKG